MSFPGSGANFTFNSSNYVEGLTVSDDSPKQGVAPNSIVITAYIDSTGKGGGPTPEQIWQAQPSDFDGYFIISNPESGLVLTVQDGGSIVVDVPGGPKDSKLDRQAWQPVADSSSPNMILAKSAYDGQVLTMPGGQSGVQVVTTKELPEGNEGRQYQLWQPAPV